MSPRRALPLAIAVSLLAAAPAARADVPVAKATAACPGAAAVPTKANVRQARAATLCLLNLERRARGLKPLRADARLRTAAQRHSRNMATRNFFDHVSPSGSTPLARVRRAGYRGAAVGENIAWGGATLSTPISIHRMWMKSPGHRRNILRAGYRDVGIGVAIGTPAEFAGATYTQNFGSRA